MSEKCGSLQNKLREEDIQKILDTYEKREDVERYAHLAKFDEIKENDFNLNIPRYVDTFVPEPPVDLKKVAADLHETNVEIEKNQRELVGMLKELTSDDSDIMDGLDAIIKELRLKPQETKVFMENSFRDGELRTTGTDMEKVLPAVSRFGSAGSKREDVKEKVMARLQQFFERYFTV